MKRKLLTRSKKINFIPSYIIQNNKGNLIKIIGKKTHYLKNLLSVIFQKLIQIKLKRGGIIKT